MDQDTGDATAPRLGRQLLVLRVASGVGAAALAAGEAAARPPRGSPPGAAPSAATRARTDADPSDAPGYGQRRSYGGGRTDNDPRDAAGYGSGPRTYYNAPRRSAAP